MNGCIAYGDCNTEGLKDYHEPVWPEMVAEHLGLALTNCGHTMSTTRELLCYAEAFPPQDYQLAFIQYGLVDSWLTFRGAPYVLYYPDTPRRKLARKLVKKLKKWTRRFHLQERWGAVEQVPLREYLGNIERVVRSAPDTLFVLVATPPNLDEPRNPRIERYNEGLQELAEQESNAIFVNAYQPLWQQKSQTLMSDGTHLTLEGHRLVADAAISALSARWQVAPDKKLRFSQPSSPG
ncbi:GDSL-type esterase/lipase family protein [Marinobacter sp. TBZ242]|uniref:GDSL-type esterase/lipase family protein n=1 Tax=Marinobacter azerbaijanicus TaxID=3050455 RepID=A0ABT7IGP1_9GAMM|nr:GDSL-type esterase/lipase family protein [Marinobacter sp. TBZ242]MDL0433337.1 GDSL-type esterase/lipase family protein [Marinobacter sp. TBZ242]